MANNEVDRVFPKPSRVFDGKLLDPILVIEDFEETVGKARKSPRVHFRGGRIRKTDGR